ncbi:MAG: 4-(cytidine 5'-diphospho)-2-C-methyl-D-erythritol kinase [Firmicutes bacterium]|nr:4-(cytidine 5'-diphospho)-2-C-methyl-D-erythritol kinase [Bacillota bacterium]
MEISVKAYAKVNLILNVLGRRPDGYHELETVFQAVDLFDDVSVSVEEGSGIVLDPGRPDLPSDSGNLAYRAAEAVVSRFGIAGSISIRIVKRIPTAAGLAGGSADCAATLFALTSLLDLDRETVFGLAKGLGSDVPFCLASLFGETAALGYGTGTELKAIGPTDCLLVLSTPDISVPTKDVYKALIPSDYERPYDIEPFINGGALEEKAAAMGNHLQAPALRLFPEIRETLDLMRRIPGALMTGLSGSGPTVFSVFEPGAEPDLGAVKQKNRNTFAVRTLPRA